MYHVHCIFTVYFDTTLSMSPFLFLSFFFRSHSKTGVVNQMIRPCFRRMSAIGQLKVLVAMAENEE